MRNCIDIFLSDYIGALYKPKSLKYFHLNTGCKGGFQQGATGDKTNP